MEDMTTLFTNLGKFSIMICFSFDQLINVICGAPSKSCIEELEGNNNGSPQDLLVWIH